MEREPKSMAAAASLVYQSSSLLRGKAAALLLLLITLTPSQAQTCTAELTKLNVCAPFVVPGANSVPSSECCGALQSVQHDRLCNTLRIASGLPSACNILSVRTNVSLVKIKSPTSEN
ncbi:hypothetical protein Ancab_009614 [Ancistrocladus abbreviatus]